MATVSKYNALKTSQDGSRYTGATIGHVHKWLYPNGNWWERKLDADKWEINFTCTKQRKRAAPTNSGAGKGTDFHWLVLADQHGLKVNDNEYETAMTGMKFKMGHKRPHWRDFSYRYPEQLSYRQSLITKLEQVLEELKEEEAMSVQPLRTSLEGL